MKSPAATLLISIFFSTAGAAVATPSPEDYERPVVYPNLPPHARDAAGFVPAGWALELERSGDLNRDGAADLVLVLHMKDPKNIVEDDSGIYDPFDTNPRMLVAAFADPAKKGYSLALADHSLILRHTNSAMEPPFDGGAEIVNGTLQVSLSLFMNMGGWYTSDLKFTFRYQDGCFKLIGYDCETLKRNTGEMQSVSINYLTGKAEVVNDQEGDTWKTLKSRKLLCLGEVGDGLAFESEYRPFP